MTKLVVADEVSAHIEPRHAMAVLMNAGKPLQTSDNIFMTEWVALSRVGSGRCDHCQPPRCLSQTRSPSRARARELQVDQQVESAQQHLSAKTAIPTTKPKPKGTAETDKPIFSNQMDARMDIITSMHIPVLMGCVCVVAQSHIISRLVLVLANNSLLDLAVRSQPSRRLMRSPKEKLLMPRPPTKEPRIRRKPKVSLKAKDRKAKPTAKSGETNFDENAQADRDEPQGQDDDQEEDPEAYLVDAQSSFESEMDSDGMLDWSASEWKDYEDRIMATVACACPDSSVKPSDTWEWRGPCCLVRVHRQMRRCLFMPTWKESIWQGLTVQPQ